MTNLRAIGLMLVAMATFASGDALVKLATGTLGTGVVMLAMALFGTVSYLAIARMQGVAIWTASARHPIVLARCAIEAVTAFAMITALSLSPLVLVVSIVQAVPLFVTIAAALVLKEKVGPRRWVAVGLGLFGVLIMLRPDEAGGVTGAALAVLAAAGLAARDVTTRMAPPEVHSLQMAVLGMGVLIPVALILLPLTGGASGFAGKAAGFALAAAVVNTAGYLAITAAMRGGEVSAVAPFRYTRLLFSMLLAVVFLGEWPDGLMLVGAVIVIGSGLYVLWRERSLGKTPS